MLRAAVLPERLRLVDLTPRHVARFVGWLCDGRAQAENAHEQAAERARRDCDPAPEPLADDARRELANRTVRNALSPVRAWLATARRSDCQFDVGSGSAFRADRPPRRQAGRLAHRAGPCRATRTAMVVVVSAAERRVHDARQP
jgi:hypothetical protein